VEKVRSTFHTFHDYLNFCGEKKDDRLLTIYEISEETPINLLAKRNLLRSTRTVYPSLQIT